MRTTRLLLAVAVLALGCAAEEGGRLGIEGASCTKTSDCESPLQCIGGICTDINKEVEPDIGLHFADTGTSRPAEDVAVEVVPADITVAGCHGDGDCTAPTPKCKLITGECVECLLDGDCGGDWNCSMNKCVEGLCDPDTQWCEGGSAYKCNSDGDGYEYSTPCGDGVCIDGECLACTPGQKKCDGTDVLECNAQGSAWVAKETCQGELGCVNGLCLVCYPSDKECQDGNAYECLPDGSGWELKDTCSGACVMGKCVSPCGGTDLKFSNVGCDYWAVDLDNAKETDALGITYDAENQQFAVVVSNTSQDSAADVTVSNSAGQVANAAVPPGGLYTFNLAPANVMGSTLQKLAFRIESTIPIVAYQFNPSVNTGVFSNDASLLLPSHSLGSEYYAVSHPQDDPNFRGFVTIVGVEEGETQVSVTPAGSVAPGNGVAGGMAGQQMDFTLQQYDVLNLETGSMGQDLTGTFVASDKKVAVFGGSECGGSPVTNICENGTCKFWPAWSCSTMQDCPATCCCDHMEQQIVPLAAWGSTYAVGHSQFRGNESDTFVVMASQPSTTVTTNPAVAQIPQLGPGAFFKFETKENFELTADHPVLVTQYLSGEHAPTPNPDTCTLLMGMGMCMSSMADCQSDQDCGPSALPVAGDAQTGDPAMILLPAVEQLRSEYMFLVPQFYSGGNYLTIVSPAGTEVLLDNTPVAAGSTFAGAAYRATIAPVVAGVHKLTSDTPFSVMVHGYDSYVSYGYTAGMNVQPLQ